MNSKISSQIGSKKLIRYFKMDYIFADRSTPNKQSGYMSNLLSDDAAALKMLMNDDLYLIQNQKPVPVAIKPVIEATVKPVENSAIPESEISNEVKESLAIIKPSQPDKPAIANLPGSVEIKSINKPAEASEDFNAKVSYTDFNYIGENNKYFLILIEDQIHTNLKAAHKEMLVKILQAKKMDLRDVAIVNVQKYPDVTFAQLKQFFVCSRLLILGIPASGIGLPPGNLNLVNKINEVKTLTSYSLTEMENDKVKKREFWNVVKEF